MLLALSIVFFTPSIVNEGNWSDELGTKGISNGISSASVKLARRISFGSVLFSANVEAGGVGGILGLSGER